MSEFVYGFVIACGIAAIMLACAILLRVREPSFARGLAWGAGTGVVVALAVLAGLIMYVAGG